MRWSISTCRIDGLIMTDHNWSQHWLTDWLTPLELRNHISPLERAHISVLANRQQAFFIGQWTSRCLCLSVSDWPLASGHQVKHCWTSLLNHTNCRLAKSAVAAANVHPCENHSVWVCVWNVLLFFVFRLLLFTVTVLTPATQFATFFAYLKIGVCVCPAFVVTVPSCFLPLLFSR